MSQIIFSAKALHWGANGSNRANYTGEPMFSPSGLFGTSVNQIMAGDSFNFGIYKGAPPTQAEVDAASGVLAANFRSADLLIKFSTNFTDDYGRVSAMRNILTSKLTGGSWLYLPPVATALLSGEAAWFAFKSNPCQMLLTGNVSLEGAGGDLQMISTTIVKDEGYALPPWIFSIPNIVNI